MGGKKLGNKSGGLGAQKVKANFADLEKEAELADSLRMESAKVVTTADVKTDNEVSNECSARRTYQYFCLILKSHFEF